MLRDGLFRENIISKLKGGDGVSDGGLLGERKKWYLLHYNYYVHITIENYR